MTSLQFRNVRIGGAGNCCLDYLFVAPVAVLGGFSPVQEYAVQGGGLTATALVTCARLGAETHFVSVLGADTVADVIAQELAGYGVNCEDIHCLSDIGSPVSFVHIEMGTGERTIYHYLNKQLRWPATGTLDALADGDVLLVDDVYPELGVAAARFARSKGIPVIADTTPTEGNRGFLAEVDIVIAPGSVLGVCNSDLDIKALMQQYHDYGPRIVVLTLGRAGWAVSGPEGYCREEAFEVAVKDTTGAGDVFHGAFGFGWAQGWDIRTCGRFASATAAVKCTRLGGRAGIPKRDEVVAFLNQH